MQDVFDVTIKEDIGDLYDSTIWSAVPQNIKKKITDNVRDALISNGLDVYA